MENVVYKGKDSKNVTHKQSIIVLEVHGDNYKGRVPGLVRPSKKTSTTLASTTTPDIPICKKFIESSEKKHRVGGVLCSRRQFGPGVYNVLCYVPKTTDKSTKGRGYVFAVWPYHYEEIYKGKSDPSQPQPDKTQARGKLINISASKGTFPCYNSCDGGTTEDSKCPSQKSCTDDDNQDVDAYSIINHEIDIEIPCNSPQFDWGNQMKWNTMNVNTWVNDIGNYDKDTGAYYSQVAVKKDGGDFISEEKENSTKKDYHWYTIDWYVNNDDFTKNYVKVYFDDPFDPKGTTKFPDGNLLPKKPSKSHLFATQRFIPTRAGRLNVGPWMGWWGYGGPKKSPNFDTSKVRLAQLSISPYENKGFDFPQNYDQVTPFGTLTCGIRDLYSVAGDGQKTPPKPPPKPSPKKKLTWLWVLISVLVFFIIIGIFLFWYIKNHKSRIT